MKCFTMGNYDRRSQFLHFAERCRTMTRHLVQFCYSTNFHMSGDMDIIGKPGHWTMEDGYDTEMLATYDGIYPFRVST